MITILKKIILPPKFTGTIISIAKKEHLIENYDINGINTNGDLSKYNLNPKSEQQFFHLMFLCDEILLTGLEYELFDLTKLCKLTNLRFLDYHSQNKLISERCINHIVPDIDYDFSRLIKESVIHGIKNDMAPFYKT